jgi:hypothetical protein
MSSSKLSALYVSEIPALLKEQYTVNPKMSSMFWGEPGLGKTESVYQFAEDMKKIYPDFFCNTFITSQMESIDFSMPYVFKKEGDVAVYKKIPIQDFVMAENARGVIFLDELPNAAPDVQKASQSIQTDRAIGDQRLPDGVMILAAGNYKKDRAGSNGLLGALANRLEHYYVTPNFEGFFKWGMKNGLHHSILSYLKMHEQNLHNYKSDEERNPTPRIWARLSQYMHFYDKHSSDFTRRRVASLVGDSIAIEFMQHLRCFDQFPSKEEIIRDPQKAKLPKDVDVQYALAIAIFNWLDGKNRDPLIEYMLRFNLEFQGMVFKQCKEHKPEVIINNKQFTQWSTKHLDLLTA